MTALLRLQTSALRALNFSVPDSVSITNLISFERLAFQIGFAKSSILL